MKRLFITMLFLITNVCFASANNTTGMFWPTFHVSGHLGNRKFPYLLELHARFFGHCDMFDRGILRLGVGVRSTEQTSFWVGYDFVPIKISNTTRIDIQQRTWQQFFMFRQLKNEHYLTVRTRLEQRYSSTDSSVAWRIRQKASIILFQFDSTGSILTLSDEIHANINHPDWIPNKFINQNRLYVAISINTSDRTITQLGYMNQIRFRDPRDEMIHILFITFKLKTN